LRFILFVHIVKEKEKFAVQNAKRRGNGEGVSRGEGTTWRGDILYSPCQEKNELVKNSRVSKSSSEGKAGCGGLGIG